MATAFGATAGAQCPGDCNDDGLVQTGELANVVDRLFGELPQPPCLSTQATSADLIAAVRVALTAISLNGVCCRPGPAGRSLEPCDRGTTVHAFVSATPTPRQIATGATLEQGDFSLGECGEVANGTDSCRIMLEANVGDFIFRTCSAGREAKPRGNPGADACVVTPLRSQLSPTSTAAFGIVQELGFDNFVPNGINNVFAAIQAANATTVFDGLDPGAAVERARATATAAPAVQETIGRSLRPTSTPTLTSTPTITPTPSPTPTPTPRRYLAYVVNADTGMVSVIDTQQRRVVHRFQSGPSGIRDHPRFVAISADDKVVCVSNNGESGVGSSLSVIDVAPNPENDTLRPPIIPAAASKGVSGLAFSPDFDSSHIVYTTTDSDTQKLFQINIDTNAKASVVVDNKAYAVAISSAPVALYVTKSNASTVARILPSLATEDITTIQVGPKPRGIAIRHSSPNHPQELAFVANSGADTVSVIDIATGTPNPTPVRVEEAPEGVAVSRDGAHVYVTNLNAAKLSIIDADAAAQNPGSAVIATVTVELQPFGVAITPDGAFAYVTNRGSDSVSVIDTQRARTSPLQAVVATIREGISAPQGVAITSFEAP